MQICLLLLLLIYQRTYTRRLTVVGCQTGDQLVVHLATSYVAYLSDYAEIVYFYLLRRPGS